jgi:psiF repeat
MRFSTLAAAVVLSLSAIAGSAAVPSALADVPPAGAPATASAAAAPGTPAATPPSDAAAKHAKRTACLKDAKAKKLVGADKTSFLKTCIAAP